MRYGYYFFLLPVIVCFAACRQQPEADTLLELLPPEQTGVTFSNEIREDEQLNIVTFEYFYNGGGVGVGDFNRDGLQDLFFTSNMGSSKLYLNEGSFTFKDITASSGINTSGKWAAGVSIVDINQDSLPDIYICYAGPWTSDKRANELYINNGDNTFSEKAVQYGLADTGHSVQAAFFDYDKDGDLDMYLLTNFTDETGPNVIRPKRLHGEMLNTDRLYRNNGNATYTDVSREAGITIEGYGLGISICDLNEDGWPDVYVTNDYLSNDLLYLNNRNGSFTNHAATVFKHTSYSAMGNDVADYNNDGRPDIIAADMLPPDNYRKKMMLGANPYNRYRSEMQYGYSPQFMRNTLQLNRGMDNNGLPAFSETGQLAGIDATDWSWSTLFADLDNDGWRDLLVTNGYPRDITDLDFITYRAQQLMKGHYNESYHKRMMEALLKLDGAHLHNFVFSNERDLTFKDQSAAWGFTQASYSTGAAYTDLDNDGDLDIVINNTGLPAFIYKNNTNKLSGHHYLDVQLNGPPGNLQGLGATIRLYAKGNQLYHEHYPVRGYQSTVGATAHFGLGKEPAADSIIITWPNGKEERLYNIKADQLLKAAYTNSKAPPPSTTESNTARTFQPANKKYQIDYCHKETSYTDFNIQSLLPHKLSQNGPGIAVGDMNGDRLEDFFVGGAYNQPGQLFFQQPGGHFTSTPLTTGKKYEEDMGALLFDADNDGDNDLYIVSGGNEFENGSPYYLHRLYTNNGKGQFQLSSNALPAISASGSCVIAADYDADGDLDLFTGGRISPQQYPEPGISLLLENNNGHFTDVTDQKAPGLKNTGMVTAALWSDINNDQQPDLIIVGEWMPVTIFLNNKGRLVNATQQYGLANSTGWWNSIQAADFDQDGQTDYILGNLGINSRYRTSATNPLQMQAFTNTGRREAIISYSQDGVSYPIHPRDDVMQRMPGLKKKFPLYKDYAMATMKDLLPPEMQQQARTFSVNTFRTSYLHNNGAKPWQLIPLCTEAQFAPVFGILAGDYDNDGLADVLLTGNWYATENISGQYDAFKGLFLKGDGTGKFSVTENGFCVDGDAKGFAEIITKTNNTLLLAAVNNDSLRVLEHSPVVNNKSKILFVQPGDAYAIIELPNGKKIKQEFYYGSGYLSHSGRHLRIPEQAKTVIIYDYKGGKRELPGRRKDGKY